MNTISNTTLNTNSNTTSFSGMEEMDLKQILELLIGKIWLIILIPLIFSIITGMVSLYLMDPVYETSTTIYVNEKKEGAPLAYSDLTLSSQLVSDYRVLIKSRMFTEPVIKKLDLQNISAAQLAERITVNAINDTRLIEIKVQDKNPALACNIANELANVFKEKITEIISIENITIVDKAIIPSSPIKPKPLLNIAIAFFLGVLSAVGLILFVEYFDDKIRTAEDAEKLGIPLLGTVPEYTNEWGDSKND
ncbi:MAG TPA: hypothetical protein GXX49_01505 [Clostridiaceae bacterium]|nr:hypothetical protein [Clostridiaceae bacterium]